MSHHLINLDFYKIGDGTKQFWGEALFIRQGFQFTMSLFVHRELERENQIILIYFRYSRSCPGVVHCIKKRKHDEVEKASKSQIDRAMKERE